MKKFCRIAFQIIDRNDIFELLIFFYLQIVKATDLPHEACKGMLEYLASQNLLSKKLPTETIFMPSTKAKQRWAIKDPIIRSLLSMQRYPFALETYRDEAPVFLQNLQDKGCEDLFAAVFTERIQRHKFRKAEKLALLPGMEEMVSLILFRWWVGCGGGRCNYIFGIYLNCFFFPDRHEDQRCVLAERY